MDTKDIIQAYKNKRIDMSSVKDMAQYLLDASMKPIIENFNNKVKELTESFDVELESLKQQFKEEVDKIQNDLDKKGDKGDKGDSGYTPIKGIDYFDGEKGANGEDADEEKIISSVIEKIPLPKDGKDGLNGKDGSPDTALQIADKLNTKEEIVEMSVIKGLTKMFRSLQRNIQDAKRLGSSGGGGGIGNPTPESFTMNGISTTFTLANNIQAGGKAIWVFYNGQYLVPTTHFSISGKTGTLTFTPQNGEIIDVLYFRA